MLIQLNIYVFKQLFPQSVSIEICRAHNIECNKLQHLLQVRAARPKILNVKFGHKHFKKGKILKI
jgi:hypothetical protein